MVRSAWWLGLGLLLCGLGCDGRPPKLVPVSGRVTLDGAPLADAYVSFQPRGDRGNEVPGPASVGKTDSNGRFTLALVRPNEPSSPAAVGAVVGPHRVVIRKVHSAAAAPGEESGRYQEGLPARYNAETILEFTVPAGGTDKADFALTSAP